MIKALHIEEMQRQTHTQVEEHAGGESHAGATKISALASSVQRALHAPLCTTPRTRSPEEKHHGGQLEEAFTPRWSAFEWKEDGDGITIAKAISSFEKKIKLKSPMGTPQNIHKTE